MEKRKYSYAIDTYPSGKEMLDRADVSLQYDIVFLDINMEEMDGLETAQHIRKISSKVFIVFVTAFITYALQLFFLKPKILFIVAYCYVNHLN